MTTRVASHAGSWYTANSSKLSRELDAWLAEVKKKKIKTKENEVEESGATGSEAKESQAEENQAEESEAVKFPIPGARVIIAP
jgi:predicted class III extradiol MEMO1 family dioxygenase